LCHASAQREHQCCGSHPRRGNDSLEHFGLIPPQWVVVAPTVGAHGRNRRCVAPGDRLDVSTVQGSEGFTGFAIAARPLSLERSAVAGRLLSQQVLGRRGDGHAGVQWGGVQPPPQATLTAQLPAPLQSPATRAVLCPHGNVDEQVPTAPPTAPRLRGTNMLDPDHTAAPV
jgi:hypothetical protein